MRRAEEGGRRCKAHASLDICLICRRPSLPSPSAFRGSARVMLYKQEEFAALWWM